MADSRGGGGGGGGGRPSGTFAVKNRMPSEIQITAEQLMLEARDRAEQAQPPAPKRHVADVAELAEHRLRIRKEFEDRLRMNRNNVAVWLRYAKWEDGQKELDRARSIYERALDVDYKNVQTWIRYAESEMRAKFVNRARNVWDRACSLLPRVETFWFKYTYLEEILGNADGARLLFERWMQWEPAEQAWLTYVKFEERMGRVDRARGVLERLVACRPTQTAYLRYAKWEERHGQRALAVRPQRVPRRRSRRAQSCHSHSPSYSRCPLPPVCPPPSQRRVLERCVDELRPEEKDEALFVAFATFEACVRH